MTAGSVGTSYSTPFFRIGEILRRSCTEFEPWAPVRAGTIPRSDATANVVRRDRIGVSFLTGTAIPACDRQPSLDRRTRLRDDSRNPSASTNDGRVIVTLPRRPPNPASPLH